MNEGHRTHFDFVFPTSSACCGRSPGSLQLRLSVFLLLEVRLVLVHHKLELSIVGSRSWGIALRIIRS